MWLPEHAAAQIPSPGESPYQLSLTWDLTTYVASGAAWALPGLLLGGIVRPSCPCNSASLNPIDRIAVGHRSATISLASDVDAGVLLAAPFLLDSLDVYESDGTVGSYGTDVAVMVEAILVNGALNEMVKATVGRPRPWVYDRPASDGEVGRASSYTSFYSAHTSAAFAAGISYAYTYALRHPEGVGRWFVLGGVLALGSGVGALRVATSAHFPSDVLVGAAAGTAVGVIVPWLHTKARGVNFGVARTDGGGLLSLSMLLP